MFSSTTFNQQLLNTQAASVPDYEVIFKSTPLRPSQAHGGLIYKIHVNVMQN